jgi:hypothetical protein
MNPLNSEITRLMIPHLFLYLLMDPWDPKNQSIFEAIWKLYLEDVHAVVISSTPGSNGCHSILDLLGTKWI